MSVFGLTPFFNTPLTPFGNDVFDALTTSAARQPRAGGDYNIERIGDSDYRISILATGLSEEDIDIEEKGGTLTIRATAPTPEEDSNYLHCGIGVRSFVRQFHLEEHVRVTEAQLDRGLLYISLTRDIPEAEKARKISVANTAKA